MGTSAPPKGPPSGRAGASRVSQKYCWVPGSTLAHDAGTSPHQSMGHSISGRKPLRPHESVGGEEMGKPLQREGKRVLWKEKGQPPSPVDSSTEGTRVGVSASGAG